MKRWRIFRMYLLDGQREVDLADEARIVDAEWYNLPPGFILIVAEPVELEDGRSGKNDEDTGKIQ